MLNHLLVAIAKRLDVTRRDAGRAIGVENLGDALPLQPALRHDVENNLGQTCVKCKYMVIVDNIKAKLCEAMGNKKMF